MSETDSGNTEPIVAPPVTVKKTTTKAPVVAPVKTSIKVPETIFQPLEAQFPFPSPLTDPQSIIFVWTNKSASFQASALTALSGASTSLSVVSNGTGPTSKDYQIAVFALPGVDLAQVISSKALG